MTKIAFEIKLKETAGDYLKLQKLSSKLGLEKNYIISKDFVEQKDFLSPVVF